MTTSLSTIVDAVTIGTAAAETGYSMRMPPVPLNPWALNPEPWALNPEPWALNPEPWALNPEPWPLAPV